ncbi:MAG: hypothetical protein DWQ08_11260 [Proteobacteria bacterium]|nr:MAG: hypothetical protein DWQ08_11260 [Pseudomonadota bacterium]
MIRLSYPHTEINKRSTGPSKFQRPSVRAIMRRGRAGIIVPRDPAFAKLPGIESGRPCPLDPHNDPSWIPRTKKQ